MDNGERHAADDTDSKGVPMIRTPLCDRLGITHPILNASMARTATGRLAAAVSNAGGFGMIGGSAEPEWLREQIRVAKSLTDRPFGVGFISSFADTADLAAIALEEGVAAVNHSFADPTPHVAATRAAGALLFTQVQSLAQAVRAAEAGVDVIIAQGGDAGGHAGQIGTFALLPAVVDAVAPIPVVAAGGVADGRGLAAALMLGAQGAWMGTRFIASSEWGGPAWEQAAVLAATSDDTVQTRLYDLISERVFPVDVPDRVLRNEFVAAWAGREDEIPAHRDELRDTVAVAGERADGRVVGVSAGIGAGLIRTAKPAAAVIEDIVREAEAVLRERPAAVLA